MDLNSAEVAKLLGVQEPAVLEWAKAGSLPHYEIKGELRFGQAELESWMLTHDSILEEAYQKSGSDNPGQHNYSLFRAVNRGGVLTGVEGVTKEDIIRHVTKHVSERFDLDADVLSELLLDREKLMSTGIGHGVAIPHTRDFFLDRQVNVVTVVFPKNPIEYGSIDHEPVRAMFFLFACDSKNHLHLLSKVAHINHDKDFRKLLQKNPDNTKVIGAIQSWERALVAKAR